MRMDHCFGKAELFYKYMDEQTIARIVDDLDLCRMWARCALEYGDRTAVIYDGCSVTYAELDREIASRLCAITP